MEYTTLHETKINSHTSSLFGLSEMKIELLNITADKTNEIVNAISDRLNHVADVSEETLDKLNNISAHASLEICNEGSH